jgi:hypothetical protein
MIELGVAFRTPLIAAIGVTQGVRFEQKMDSLLDLRFFQLLYRFLEYVIGRCPNNLYFSSAILSALADYRSALGLISSNGSKTNQAMNRR